MPKEKYTIIIYKQQESSSAKMHASINTARCFGCYQYMNSNSNCTTGYIQRSLSIRKG